MQLHPQHYALPRAYRSLMLRCAISMLSTATQAWRRTARVVEAARNIARRSGDARWRLIGVDLPEVHSRARDVPSFTMLPINTDEHALMKRFHKPGDEKRMVVILDEAEYDAWLNCSIHRMRDFLLPFPAERLQADAWPKH